VQGAVGSGVSCAVCGYGLKGLRTATTGRGFMKMATIRVETGISAPLERCFDLARDIDFHIKSLAATGERAVAGRTSGLIELGERVTWEGRHFGVRQRFTAEVVEFDRPQFFRDVMVAGAFREFAHDHRFDERDGVTVMTDVVTFRAPGGVLGRVVDALVLKRYLRRLIAERGMAIQREAEERGR
jgi:ligand-binding SRPBCC domain-containing protein